MLIFYPSSLFCYLNNKIQVAAPFGEHDGFPISISFISAHGADKFLLDTVVDMYPILQEEIINVLKSSPLPDSNGSMDAADLLKEKVLFLRLPSF